MVKRNPWGILLIEVAFGRWRWDAMFFQVHYIPRGRRKPVETLYLRTRDNTPEGALKAVIMHLSPRPGGRLS